MNRKLLPSLIALMTVGAANVVNADSVPMPTVYGKVNVTLNKYTFDDIQSGTSVKGQDNWMLESNSSRLGVKGDYPLFGETKAIYKLEYEVFADSDKSNSSQPFKQRNTYAGLQSEWGTLFAGKNDTPLKATTAETTQLFKDLPLGDYKYVLVGENRENNIVQYTTPNLAGVILSAQLILGEDTGASDSTTASKSKDQNSGLANKYSLAATYKLDTLYVALAHDHNVQNTDLNRLVAQYGIGPVTIGGLYQDGKRHFKDPATSATANSSNAGKIDKLSDMPTDNLTNTVGNPIYDFAGGKYDKQKGYGLDVAWKIDNDWTLKGQYVRSKSDPVDATGVGQKETVAKNLVVGVDYALSKAAKVFAYYASIKTDGDIAATLNSESLDDKTFAVGWEFKF